jgi:hypothetical protein
MLTFPYLSPRSRLTFLWWLYLDVSAEYLGNIASYAVLSTFIIFNTKRHWRWLSNLNSCGRANSRYKNETAGPGNTKLLILHRVLWWMLSSCCNCACVLLHCKLLKSKGRPNLSVNENRCAQYNSSRFRFGYAICKAKCIILYSLPKSYCKYTFRIDIRCYYVKATLGCLKSGLCVIDGAFYIRIFMPVKNQILEMSDFIRTS